MGLSLQSMLYSLTLVPIAFKVTLPWVKPRRLSHLLRFLLSPSVTRFFSLRRSDARISLNDLEASPCWSADEEIRLLASFRETATIALFYGEE